MAQLHDLIEYRFDHQRGVFVKKETHLTNQPSALCYGQKRKIEFLRPTSRYTRFKVVKNGEKQYSNQF